MSPARSTTLAEDGDLLVGRRGQAGLPEARDRRPRRSRRPAAARAPGPSCRTTSSTAPTRSAGADPSRRRRSRRGARRRGGAHHEGRADALDAAGRAALRRRTRRRAGTSRACSRAAEPDRPAQPGRRRVPVIVADRRPARQAQRDGPGRCRRARIGARSYVRAVVNAADTFATIGQAPSDARARLLHRSPHRLERGLGRAVRVDEPGLPAGPAGLVVGVEEEHAGDVRLAVGELDRAPVRGRLRGLGDRPRRRGLDAAVELALVRRDRRLDPELVVEDRHPRADLRGAVEGLAEQPDEHVLVDQPEMVGVGGQRVDGDARVERVGMEREAVHDRQRRGRSRGTPRRARGGSGWGRSCRGRCCGLSTPRGASAPPQTRTSGAAALSAS